MPALDPTKVKVRTSFAHTGTLYGLALEPGTPRAYVGSEDYGLHVYDLSSAKKEPLARWAKHDNYVSAVALVARSDKTVVVSGSYDRSLVWWDPKSGTPGRVVHAHQGWVRDLIAVPGGQFLASCGDDMLVKIWEIETGKLVRTLVGHETRTPQGHVTALYTLAATPDGKHLASADRHGTVLLWDLATGKVVKRLEAPTLYTYDPRQRKRSIGGIRALCFSPDGKHLAAGGIGQVGNVDGLAGPAHIEIWDWNSGALRLASQAQGHKGIINDLLWMPDGSWLVGGGGGSDGGFVAFWEVAKLTEKLQGQKVKSDGHIHRLALDPTGTNLVAAGHKKLDVWALT